VCWRNENNSRAFLRARESENGRESERREQQKRDAKFSSMNFAFCAALSRRSPSRSLPLCFCFVVIVGGQCIDYRREQGTLLHSPAWLHHHPLPFPSPSLRLPLHDDDNDVASG